MLLFLVAADDAMDLIPYVYRENDSPNPNNNSDVKSCGNTANMVMNAMFDSLSPLDLDSMAINFISIKSPTPQLPILRGV